MNYFTQVKVLTHLIYYSLVMTHILCVCVCVCLCVLVVCNELKVFLSSVKHYNESSKLYGLFVYYELVLALCDNQSCNTFYREG